MKRVLKMIKKFYFSSKYNFLEKNNIERKFNGFTIRYRTWIISILMGVSFGTFFLKTYSTDSKDINSLPIVISVLIALLGVTSVAIFRTLQNSDSGRHKENARFIRLYDTIRALQRKVDEILSNPTISEQKTVSVQN